MVEQREKRPFRDELFEPMEPTNRQALKFFFFKVAGKMRNW